MAETATRKSSVASRAQAVENVDTDVDIKYIPAEAEITPPPALAALSDEEVAKLGKKAMLKLDLRIMPAIVIMYILNYLDRQNIASAKLANIITDLHMTNVEFQTCISLLFVGYILMQVPSNMFAGKTRYPGVYICVAMGIWGVISACTAGVHNFTGLVVTRFFLGFVEAAFFPGALFYISLFYSRKQFALRTAILYSGSQVGNAIGPLFAIGILNLDGSHGIEGWRWLFLIEGVLTIAFAIGFAFFLPNGLKNLSGFSEMEQEYLLWNYGRDIGQQDNKDEITAWKGLVMAAQDPKTWLLMGILWSVYVSAAVNNWFPSVVATLGFSRNTTYGLTAPPYLLCVPAMLINGFHSDKKQERFLHIAGPLVVTIIANIIAVSTLNTGARYFAMMLMPGSFYASSIVILSWITGSLSQPSVKRASAIALINAVCNTPNIWTAYVYVGPPRYLAAFLMNLAAAALAIVFAVATYLYLRRHNARLDRGEDTGKNGPTAAQQAAGFRYTL